MSVNLSEQALFDELEQLAAQNPDAGEMTLEKFRQMGEMFLQYAGAATDVPYENTTVPARDGYDIPIRIYNPHLDASKPVLIMYPGCGYVLDLFESNAIAASRVAKYGDCKVILVNFRLCPEVTMPKPVEDAFDATQFIGLHPEQFAIDPAQIYIGGMSSGAHAAANVALFLRGETRFTVRHQILVNGAYDLTQSHTAYKAYELKDKICQRGEGIDFMWEQYGVTTAELADPIMSPIFTKDVSGLPATTFLIAEYDGVRSDSEAFYELLASQNDEVYKIVLQGQTHNTILMRGVMSDGEDPALTMARVINSSEALD